MDAIIEQDRAWVLRPEPPPRPRMLVVEDDPATCTALRTILGHKGWDVSVAGTLAAAGDLLGAQPDCMILDLELPDGNGLALLQRIRQRQLPIRVVITTGSGDAEFLRTAVRLRPEALLRKPLNLAELLRVVDAAEPVN